MRRILLLAACSILATHFASAQGWVGNTNGHLYAVNDSLKFSTLYVGIGTNQPNAQLHTTGSVRLAGLTQNNTYSRLLVQDGDGRLYWRDASSLSTGAGWGLTGNAGTSAGTNFLGTTDDARLVFRTNNTEKATILSNGNVGVGLAQPAKMLHVHNNGSEDNNIYVSGLAPSIYFAQSEVQPRTPYTTPYARFGLATRKGTFAPTSETGDFIIHNITQGGSILFALGADASGANGIERARFSSNGSLGINTTNPTAKLHVNGNVRFQNLSTNTGKSLVVDDSGYVYVSNTSSANADLTALQDEVAVLKEALAEVKAQLAELKNGNVDVVDGGARKTYDLSASPNPFNGVATIKYVYPSSATAAYLIISDLNGAQLKRYDLRGNNNSSVTISLDGAANAGTYIYSLVIDGKTVSSKKMIYNK